MGYGNVRKKVYGGGSERGGYTPLTSLGPATSAGGSYASAVRPGMSAKEALRVTREMSAANATGNGDKVTGQDDRAAAALVKLLRSPDKEAQKEGVKALSENYDLLSAGAVKKYGLSDAISSVKGAKEAERKAKDQPWYKDALGGAAKVLEVISRPQQAVAETLQAGLVDAGTESGIIGHIPIVKEFGYQYNPDHTLQGDKLLHRGGYKDALRALAGQERTDASTGEKNKYLEYSNALGVPLADIHEMDRPSGYAGSAANFVGGAALDPLNFITGGQSKTAQQGLEAATGVIARDLAEQGTGALTKDLARQIGKTGAQDVAAANIKTALQRTGLRKALTTEQRAAVRESLLATADEKLATKGLLTEAGVKRQVAIRGGAEKAADKALERAIRYDRGGLRIAERTVVPERVRSAVRPIFKDTVQHTSPAALEANVVRQAGERAAEYEARAARQASLHERAVARANRVLETSQEIPYAALQDQIDQVATGLDELKAAAPSGRVTREFVDDDMHALLRSVADDLHTQAGRAVRQLPDAELTPEASFLLERADEFDTLLSREDYAGLQDLLTEAGPVPGTVANGRNVLPLTNARAAQRDAMQALTGADKEAAAAAKGYGSAVNNRETLLENLRSASEDAGGASGIPLSAKAQSALDSELAKAGKYTETAQELQSRADALYAASNGGDVQRLLELDPGLGDALADSRVIARQGIGGRISRSKLGDIISSAFDKRGGIRRSTSLPADTADKMYRLSTEARSASNQRQSQLLRRIYTASKAAGKLSNDEITVFRDALETPGSVPDTIQSLREAGDTAKADLLETLDNVRTEDYQTLIDSGLADAMKLRATDDYLNRSLTKAGRKAALTAERTGQGGPFRASGAKIAGNQGGSLNARTLTKDFATITEAEDALGAPLRESGVLKEGKTLFEQDPRSLVAKRSIEITKAKESADLIDSLSENVKDALGGNLVERIPAGATAKEVREQGRAAVRRGLEQVDLGESGTAFVHPDLVPEVKNVLDTLSDSEAITALGRAFDGWNRVWKSYATVPIVGGGGFHARNAIGNIYNNFLAGVTNPRYYGEAVQLQLDVSRAKRAFPHLSIPDALERAGTDTGRIAKVEAALEQGVIDEGFFANDLSKLKDSVVPTTGKGKVKELVNPVGNKNVLVRPGTAIGRNIEENARMAHFLSKLQETGSIADSAMSVKKYLFDYGDLTPFERKVAKRVNAFYTFTRKNTPLQIVALAETPVKFNQARMLQDTLLGSDDPGGAKAPIYLQRGNQSFVGRQTAKNLSGGKNPVVAGFDTPFASAAQQLDPAVQLAALIPGLKSAVPDSMKAEDPAKELGKELIGQTSGGPIEALKIAFEEASGNSAYTGAAIKVDGKRKVNPYLRLSQAIAPIVSKTVKTYDPNGKDTARLRLAKALTGLMATEITPEMTEKEQKHRVYELEQALQQLKSKGVDVPTVTELRNAQLIPKLPKRKRR